MEINNRYKQKWSIWINIMLIFEIICVLINYLRMYDVLYMYSPMFLSWNLHTCKNGPPQLLQQSFSCALRPTGITSTILWYKIFCWFYFLRNMIFKWLPFSKLFFNDTALPWFNSLPDNQITAGAIRKLEFYVQSIVSFPVNNNFVCTYIYSNQVISKKCQL